MKASKEVRDFLAEAGRKGRGVNSPAQVKAAKQNGKKGGRPPKNTGGQND